MTESPSDMPGRASIEPVEESVLTASVRDLPTSLDSLGFAPYVEAIADFLTSENTKPPLTLSVEGDWGSGKSSFMQQLVTEIEKRSGAPIVEFNAWRHDKEEALWAAFALEFTRKLSQQLKPWWRRWWAHILLVYRRFNWQEGWVDVLRALGVALVFFAAAIACLLLLLTKGFAWTEEFVRDVPITEFWQHIIKVAIASGGIAGYVVLVVSVWRRLADLVGNPLAIDLRRYAKSPDYEGRVAFIEQFHEDFEHVVKAYAGKAEKVYVFIDDLDRCAVPKSAELMQALNLMLSQSAQLIYILGMDREKVAAAYAAKDADLLPFLARTSTLLGTTLEISYDRVVGLEYGYAFVEKFVQLPFHVPQPTEDDVRRLLASLETTVAGKQAREQAEEHSMWRKGLWNALRARLGRSRVTRPTDIRGAGLATEEQKEVRKRIKLDVTQDSATIRNIVLMVSAALDNNPRRILQFINLFRLRTFIACDTALFDEIEQNTENNPLTLEQLGKFVAITLRWPLLFVDLEWYPQLLAHLEKIALESRNLGESIREIVKEPDTEGQEMTLRRWAEQQDLLRLLRAGFLDDSGNVDPDKGRRYSLVDINVEKLLQVSPRTRPPAATPESPLADDNVAALIRDGRLSASRGRYEEAIASYSRALALRPDLPEALNALGEAYTATGRYEEAMLRYEQALEIRPDFPEALQNRKGLEERMSATEEVTEDDKRRGTLAP